MPVPSCAAQRGDRGDGGAVLVVGTGAPRPRVLLHQRGRGGRGGRDRVRRAERREHRHDGLLRVPRGDGLLPHVRHCAGVRRSERGHHDHVHGSIRHVSSDVHFAAAGIRVFEPALLGGEAGAFLLGSPEKIQVKLVGVVRRN